LDVYDTTQDPDALKVSAKISIEGAFERYLLEHPEMVIATNEPIVAPPPTKKQRRFATNLLTENELTTYLKESRIPGNSNPLEYWKLNKKIIPSDYG
jgi:hypothetical protein